MKRLEESCSFYQAYLAVSAAWDLDGSFSSQRRVRLCGTPYGCAGYGPT